MLSTHLKLHVIHIIYVHILESLLLWWNTMTKESWKEGFMSFTVPYNSSFSNVVREGSQPGQKTGGMSWCRGHGGLKLTGLPFITCSACFLIECGITRLGMSTPIKAWIFTHKPLIKNMLYRLAYSQNLCRYFLTRFMLMLNPTKSEF